MRGLVWAGIAISVLATAEACAAAESAPSSASDWTGNDLLQYCGTRPYAEAPTSFSTGVCFGYITGVTTMLVTYSKVCPSMGVTAEQGIDVVVKYVVDHPRYRDKPSLVLVAWALKDAFPCQKN